MKLERSDVDHPLWRKKVDPSLLRQNRTTIPQWACRMWSIESDFSKCSSRKDPSSKVKIEFDGKGYEGWITIAKRGRERSPAYRLWYREVLTSELKSAFIMSFVRDIEGRLRESRGVGKVNIENEIPFWEFLDIEYDRDRRLFSFRAYYTQKPDFTDLYQKFIDESLVLQKIDDELSSKPPFRIYKTRWKKRDELELEIGAMNVLYFLVDTKNKLLYIGEASNLVSRLRQEHPSIPEWDYFRYNTLPNEIAHHRKVFERMLIRDYAQLLENKGGLDRLTISDYSLTNDKIDMR